MIEDFLRDLDRQTDLYGEMLATAEVARLQDLMREISAIDARILPIRRRWPEVARSLDPEMALRAGRSVEAAREVLARLVDRFAPPPPAHRVGQAYGSLP